MLCREMRLLTYLALSAPSGALARQPVPQFLGKGAITGSSFGLPGANATYDYVIVGGGLAGSVVATRLAEQRPGDSIAVVEAGSFYEISSTNYSQIPYYSTKFTNGDVNDYNPLIDWGLTTAPQPGANGKVFHYAQGKYLGGSSGRNQMIYNRGTKGTYKAWADVVGDDDYLWDNMLPHFKKSFHFSPPNNELRAANATPNYTVSAYDFPGGGVHMSFSNYANAIASYAPAAFASVGFNASQDFASGNLMGYGYWTSTIDPETGLRSSAESGLLSPAMERSRHLTVYQSCMGRNILFDGQKRAIGVNVTVNGVKPFTLSARKEVIVSAGAWHSPQLLMVSGIGPEETLTSHGIPVVSALEGVGQNGWDTPSLSGPLFRTTTVSATRLSTDQKALDSAINELLTNASGPLTNIGSDFWGFEKVTPELAANLSQSTKDAFAKFPADWPDFEFTVGASRSVLDASDQTGDLGSIGILMVATTSRGNMTIRSASNDVPPVISPNWIASKEDQEMAVRAFRRARQIMHAFGNRQGDEIQPGANVTTDEQIRDYFVKHGGLGVIHHMSSLCAMGRSNNSQAVVDSKGRVFGVQGLRVIDSSSFPFTPPGHTQGSTYAHAEKLVQDVIAAAM